MSPRLALMLGVVSRPETKSQNKQRSLYYTPTLSVMDSWQPCEMHLFLFVSISRQRVPWLRLKLNPSLVRVGFFFDRMTSFRYEAPIIDEPPNSANLKSVGDSNGARLHHFPPSKGLVHNGRDE